MEDHLAPSYEWYKDGVLISREVQSFFYIPEMLPDDRGNYSCKVSKGGGSVESDPTQLDVAGIYCQW